MLRNYQLSLLIPILLLFQSSRNYSTETDQPAQKINLAGMDNLYKVSDGLYRSEQPDNSDMKKLDSLGIRSVLNLRHYCNDRKETGDLNLNLHDIHVNTWTMSYEELVKSLQYIKTAEKPLLVHCKHGSDRTGVVVAGYRIVFEKWSKEDAITEFTSEQFGYHAALFPNLLRLIENIDEEKLRKDVLMENAK